jgi:hypothetical protein
MDPASLINAYPWMDQMIAETLIKSYENGTLMKHVSATVPSKAPFSPVIVGAITVSPPEEKIETI